MNNKLSLAAVVIIILGMMTSCLKDSSSSAEYDDVAVTSFTLGTLKKIVYTKNNSHDSVYTTTASCSSVKFTIDNVSNKIYNVDSLTRGIVTSKALVTIGTKNGAVAYLKSYVGDTLTYISSTDSLDFSKPRIVRVVANDGSWYKDYSVDVRVHNQPKDSVYWTQKTVNKNLGQLLNIRALCFNGKMIVYGTNSAAGFEGYTSSIKDGETWQSMNTPFAGKASMVTDGSALYAYSGNKVYTSSDNETWTETGENANINTLVAATASSLYAIGFDGQILVSVNRGKSWTEDKMDDSKAVMPTIDLQGVVTKISTNSDVKTISLFGNMGSETDSIGVMWSKIEDNDGAYSQPWQHHENYSDNAEHKMPSLDNMCVIPYAGGLVMMGGAGRGASMISAFSQFYRSEDTGLTWWKDSRFYFPSRFSSNLSNFAFAVDSDKYMWIFCGESGQVWRGYLTQMVW